MGTTLGADRVTAVPDEPLGEIHVAALVALRGGLAAELQRVGQEGAT